jgi:hypothetical protein
MDDRIREFLGSHNVSQECSSPYSRFNEMTRAKRTSYHKWNGWRSVTGTNIHQRSFDSYLTSNPDRLSHQTPYEPGTRQCRQIDCFVPMCDVITKRSQGDTLSLIELYVEFCEFQLKNFPV